MITFLLKAFLDNRDRPAIIHKSELCTYFGLLSHVVNEKKSGAYSEIKNSVVAYDQDSNMIYSIANLLALIDDKNIIAPIGFECRDIEARQTVLEENHDHPYIEALKSKGHPGLILFSSGTTGEPKAAVHDFVPLLEKFKVKRPPKVMLNFLMFDHIGGINTMLHCLSNGGTLIVPENRKVGHVCELIERYRVQVLPTTPTFLNLILLNRAHEKYDLSSLETITYGTEPMPEATLKRLHAAFPNVTLQQTYGLSELGIMRSKSRASDSLWVKIGGEGYELRVRDGMLEVKAKSAMLGYLNAPSPFTDDGWFKTGDAVEVDGEYYKILGRKSELINVGGEKVYPAEVEGVLAEMSGVESVAVSGEPHPLTGSIVKAVVKLSKPEALPDFRARMRAHCEGRLERFKIPQKVEFTDKELVTARFKTDRKLNAEVQTP